MLDHRRHVLAAILFVLIAAALLSGAPLRPAGEDQILAAITDLNDKTLSADEAVRRGRRVEALVETTSDPGLRVRYHHAIGLRLRQSGSYDEAIQSYLLVIGLAEANDLQRDLGRGLLALSEVNRLAGNFEQSEDYLDQAEPIFTALNEVQFLAGVFNNRAIIHTRREEYAEAIADYERSLVFREEVDDESGMARTYSNLGVAQLYSGDLPAAIASFEESLFYSEKVGAPSAVGAANVNLADALRQAGELDAAVQRGETALTIAREAGDKNLESVALSGLADVHEEAGELARALARFREHSVVRGEIVENKRQRAIADMQTRYQTEKTERQNELLNQNNRLQQLEIEGGRRKAALQRWILAAVALGLTGALAAALLLARGKRAQQRANAALAVKNRQLGDANREIRAQRDEITTLNEETNASIRYARSLQEALLPGPAEMSGLREVVVMHSPRDIVSGDFWWFHEVDGDRMVAACDCTGHGVPGAFVSITCHDLLTRAAVDEGLRSPGEILSAVNRGILSAFKGEEGGADEGMDAGIVRLLPSGRLEFAGANSPLVVIRDGEAIEIRGDRKSIGGRTSPAHAFTTHEVEIAADDVLFLFSDGFQDQFGGPDGKKLKKSGFKRLLVEAAARPVTEREAFLAESLHEWQGTEQRLDDVLVVGFAA